MLNGNVIVLSVKTISINDALTIICAIIFVMSLTYSLWHYKNVQGATTKRAYQKSASTRENMYLGFANNKGTDQPAHPRCMISAIVLCVLESIICRFATSGILIF